MPNNLRERVRECGEQAVYCTRQADQADPKVKRQFLELKRLWLLLARHYDETNRKSDNLPSPIRR